jgi:hypothetical protein
VSRKLVALVLAVGLVAITTWSVFTAVVPAQPPTSVEPRRAVATRMTEHLLLLIVDGLRYDVATDPVRMPEFSKAMQTKSSGEIWAGRISMTTSAVMAYGTGQRGRLEQILRNINPDPPPFNSWLANAKRSGLTLMTAGDPAWVQMYGEALADHRVDPKGVAIDVDFNPKTFRDARELKRRAPDFLVAHFVTPDHQGHAYGIRSERYRNHIRSFDQQLHALLGEFGPEWTVIVTSDHGAADSGTHGTDTSVQRRSPLYAYGRGIAPGVRASERLDQIDLAGTLAALLGVSAPAQGLGHVLVQFLDLPDERRAEIACDDAERALAYANATLTAGAVGDAAAQARRCRPGPPAAERIIAARKAVEAVDRSVSSATGLGSQTAWALAIVAVLLATALVWLALERLSATATAGAVLLTAAALGLVFGVERLPGELPKATTATFFVFGNAFVLLSLLRPALVGSFLERHRTLAPLLVPGCLLVTYTSNTQPQSYVALASLALLFAASGPLDSRTLPLLRSPIRPRPGSGGMALIVALVALMPAGFYKSELYPSVLYERADVALVTAAVVVSLWVLAHLNRAKREGGTLVVWAGLIAILGSLLARRMAPPLVGRLSILLFAIAALVAMRRGRALLATFLGVASYAWVSRDFEFLALVPSLAVAQIVAVALSRSKADERPDFAQQLALATVGFALLYVQRVGLMGAIDIGSVDWGAGGFGDPEAPAWIVGIAIAYKYVLAAVLTLSLLLGGSRTRDVTARAWLAAFSARAAVMILMLFVCGGSFWTALRVLGDLPFALTGVVAALLVWLGVRPQTAQYTYSVASGRGAGGDAGAGASAGVGASIA